MSILLAVALMMIGFTLLVLIGVALMVPAATEASERIRVLRETEDAAWDIRSRATAAFGEMLHAARSEEFRAQVRADADLVVELVRGRVKQHYGPLVERLATRAMFDKDPLPVAPRGQPVAQA